MDGLLAERWETGCNKCKGKWEVGGWIEEEGKGENPFLSLQPVTNDEGKP